MNYRFGHLVLCATALVLSPLRGAELKYLAPSTLTAVELLPAPPAPGSAEEAADLETTARVYRAGTPAEKAQAKADVKLTIFRFAPALGPWFTPGKFPKTEALFHEVEREAKSVTNAGKRHWERLRPYHADPAQFPDAIEREPKTDYSYPSGHSTRATLYSLVLAELFPDHRAELIAIGREVGWLRVVGGVHYPTDIYAGRVLGMALARDFLQNSEFQRDLAGAKEELRAAGH